MATEVFSANGIANEENDNENYSTQETPVLKKRRVLKRVLKKKKQDTSLIETCKKKKKVYRALSNSINLSTSMQKQTILANNRALAYKLEQTRQERRLLNEANIELKREHEKLWMKNTKLEAVVGIQNEEIEQEVDRRLLEHLCRLKSKLGKVGKFLLDAATLLKESMDDISVNTRTSAGSSRASSLGHMSEWLTTDMDQGCKRSLYENVPETALSDVYGIVGHNIDGPMMSSLSHDMSVIAEQSILVENISPPRGMVDSSPIQEEINAHEEKFKSSSADITKAKFVNAKPRRVLRKPTAKDDLDFSVEDLIGQEGKTEKESSEKDHVESRATEDHGKVQVDDAQTEKRSDRRGTFVISPKNVMKQLNSTQSVVTGSTHSLLSQNSEKLEESQPSEIVKKTCPGSSVNNKLEEPVTTVSSSDNDRRKTFVIPSKSSECIRNEKLMSLPADDEVTMYFNTDMDFTEVIDQNQLIFDKNEFISSESFKSKFMNDDSKPKNERTEANMETVKKDVLTQPAEVEKRSKQRQKKGNLLTKGAVKSSASDFSSKSNSDNSKVVNSMENEAASHVKPSFEFRLPKPGIFTFSATRKEIDGTRKPVPSKLPTKSRSKSKVKLTRKASKNQDEYKSPKPIQSIFDFHDKTPRIIAAHGSEAVGSVYDLSLNESLKVDPGNKGTMDQSRQEVSQKSKSMEKDHQNLEGDDNVKMDSKTKSRTKTRQPNKNKLETEVSKGDNSSEVSRGERLRTKSQSTAEPNDSDEPKGDEFSDAASAVSSTTQSKESQNILLGDKSVYYLPLKDSSPEVNVKKGRSRSQSRSKGRRSKKSDAESDTDQEIDQKSRSRSRSRRRKGDSETGIGDNAVSKRLRTKSQSMAEPGDSNEEKGDEFSESSSAVLSTTQSKEPQNVLLGDQPVYYLPLKDSSPEVNVKKGRSRSQSRSKGRSEKSDIETDIDVEIVQKSRSRSKSCGRKAETKTENDDVVRRHSRGRSRTRRTEESEKRCTRSKSRAREEMQTDKLLNDESEEEKISVEESPVKKRQHSSRDRSRSRASTKITQSVDYAHVQENGTTEESNQPGEIETSPKLLSLSSKKAIVLLKGQEDEVKSTDNLASKEQIALDDDISEVREKANTEKKLETTSRCRSRSHASTKKITVIVDESDNEESEENETKLQEQKSDGRLRNRASTKRIVYNEDSYEENSIDREVCNKNNEINQQSRSRSRSGVSLKTNFIDDNDEDINDDKKKGGKNLMLNRKSRDHSRNRVSAEPIILVASDDEEKDDEKVKCKKRDQKSRGRSKSHGSKRKFVIDSDDEEEGKTNQETRVMESPIDSVKRKSKSCLTSSKKLNKKLDDREKENEKDQTELMQDSEKKSDPQAVVLGSAEIKNQNTGNEMNLQNLRKRLAALENNQRSICLSLESRESQDKKGDEPDCKRSRRGGVVNYKEQSINVKMRQPASGSSPSQGSRSKKHVKKPAEPANVE